MFEIDDLVTVKITSPTYKWYKGKIGRVCQVPAQCFGASEGDVIVNFNGLECLLNEDELNKV
jgi:hypothetical protein